MFLMCIGAKLSGMQDAKGEGEAGKGREEVKAAVAWKVPQKEIIQPVLPPPLKRKKRKKKEPALMILGTCKCSELESIVLPFAKRLKQTCLLI